MLKFGDDVIIVHCVYFLFLICNFLLSFYLFLLVASS